MQLQQKKKRSHFWPMGNPAATSVLVAGFGYLICMVAVPGMSATSGQPDEECVAPLESLLDCLPYAQGKAPLPTTACCTNVDKVFQSDKKCLCELIAASFQGGTSSGLPPFNRTLALHMPSVCNVPADPSKCPGLLGIPASSPEAKEFASAALKPTGDSTSTTSTSSPSGSSRGSNNAPAVTALGMKSSADSFVCIGVSLPTMLALSVLHALWYATQL